MSSDGRTLCPLFQSGAPKGWDWFDVCNCGIPCPCYFAQPPTDGDCEGVLAWHIREGNYGGVPLAGLNVIALGAFTGNIWAGAKATMGIFIDERATERQREALQMIFGGKAGGWPGLFANVIAEVRGIEYVPIDFEVASDLVSWRAEIPGKVLASAEALSGPTSLPGSACKCSTPRFGSWAGDNRYPGEGYSRSSRSLRLQMGLAGTFE